LGEDFKNPILSSLSHPLLSWVYLAKFVVIMVDEFSDILLYINLLFNIISCY